MENEDDILFNLSRFLSITTNSYATNNQESFDDLRKKSRTTPSYGSLSLDNKETSLEKKNIKNKHKRGSQAASIFQRNIRNPHYGNQEVVSIDHKGETITIKRKNFSAFGMAVYSDENAEDILKKMSSEERVKHLKSLRQDAKKEEITDIDQIILKWAGYAEGNIKRNMEFLLNTSPSKTREKRWNNFVRNSLSEMKTLKNKKKS